MCHGEEGELGWGINFLSLNQDFFFIQKWSKVIKKYQKHKNIKNNWSTIFIVLLPTTNLHLFILRFNADLQ